MSATQIQKSEIINKFQTHEKDTGSSSVQIALLTERIHSLTTHLKEHRKDFHSRRGLIAMTNCRRKLLTYLKKNNVNEYNQLINTLKLRR
jgi:small subunit ribosomal protein S15